MKRLVIALVSVGALAGFAGCEEEEPSTRDKAQQAAIEAGENFDPYMPTNGVEGNNYNKAQEIYDDPSTILWCTVFPNNDVQAPVTIPIAGKLTSSSTSAFSGEDLVYDLPEDGIGPSVPGPIPSVDGLYHPNPPSYRYGFTPGGDYVDLTSLPSVCTTKPLEFQSRTVAVNIDQGLSDATDRAKEALENGDKDGAQAILEGASGE